MNCETGFLHSFGLRWVPASMRIRGEFAIGCIFVSQTCIRQDRLILTMMRSCASAAKLRAAGPFSRSASSARFEYGFPPPRIVNSAVVLNPARAPKMVLSGMLVRIKLLSGSWT
jgi:hypothetical protein